jgi:hypothetical protein
MKFKKLATLALSTMVVASMGSTAVFAEANTAEKPATPANSAYLVKYLKLADGVTNPNVAFTFNFEAKDNAPAVGTNGKVTITPTTASESEKDGASASVTWASSAAENSTWEMTGTFDPEEKRFEYHDCVRTDFVYKEDGSVDKQTEVYTGGHGFMFFDDSGDKLTMT